MDDAGAVEIGQPHWAMCLVCGDVLYAGPGINPILRECECTATAVRPTEERGYVLWDKEKYAAAGIEGGPEIEYTNEALDPLATRKAVPETTISQLYQHNMDRLNRGEQV